MKKYSGSKCDFTDECEGTLMCCFEYNVHALDQETNKYLRGDMNVCDYSEGCKDEGSPETTFGYLLIAMIFWLSILICYCLR